jgi:hypothetical protein
MNWLQLSYQYLVGGAFFFITLYLCFRPGAGDLKIGSDRRALRYLLIGFAGYLAMHTFWIIFASL